MGISDNIYSIRKNIPSNINLVAVSKKKSYAEILEAYRSGQRIFGENRVQELISKKDKLPSDINWHMIGHLQRKKVKYIASFISLIHAVDSTQLLEEINKRAAQNNRIIDCLLQVHIAQEDTKFGFNPLEIKNVIKESKEFNNINIKGLMAMATFTDNKQQINMEFSRINQLFKELKTEKLNTLSIGMSSDYQIAINNGSTMIRVGSAIFGKSN
tara:strand:+ start:138 stop:779 length:642 start_codon:yes stop_codon:yes gene_type:complete